MDPYEIDREKQYLQNKMKVVSILKKNPEAFGKIHTERAKNDKDILNAFLKGLIYKKDKFLFLRIGELGVPYDFCCTDDFLLAEAAISGLGYIHMKQLGKTDLIDDELIYTTIANLREEKERTGSAGIFSMFMLSGIPDDRLTENICFEILMLHPPAVIRLPEKFFRDSLFQRLLDNGNARWLDVGDLPYKKGFGEISLSEMFGNLSPDTIKRAVYMQREFFHPGETAVLSEKELSYISLRLPYKYKYIAYEDPEQLNLFDRIDGTDVNGQFGI